MDAAIISAVLNFALPKIYAAIEGRSKRWRDLEANMQSIETEFKFIQATIKDYHHKNRDELSNLRKAWISKLRRLAYDIEDCDRFLPPICGKKINRQGLAREIAQLKTSAEETYKSLQRYINGESEQGPLKVKGTTSNSGVPMHPSYPRGQDDWDVSVDDLVGMDEHLHALRALVMSPSEKKLKVISIVGFGGTGKTLLADLVYRDTDVRNQFPVRAFVHAAAKGKEEILEEIIKQLLLQDVKGKGVHVTDRGKGVLGASTPTQTLQTGNSLLGVSASAHAPQLGAHGGASASNEVSEDKNDLEIRLRSCLRKNRYLIVIDDVWAKELGKPLIDAFRLAKEVDGRIIVTTTIHKVATSCSSAHDRVYKMSPLNKLKAKELFVKEASQLGPLPDERELDSCEIWERCDGVPLALVCIAKFCNGELGRCKEAWRKLCTPKEEDCDLARMQGVLDHSYDSLCGLGLEACLLYFSMFPPGHPIRRASLIRRWLAEGLLLSDDRDRTTLLADAAVKNFETLIERNVIWPIQVSNNDKVKTCQPPGMMLEYISGKSILEDFIMFSCDGSRKPQDIRRLSLHHTCAEDDGQVLLNNDLHRLRSLAVFRSNKGEAALRFDKCELLRVLDLEACQGLKNNHLKDICKLLRLLKYLSLRGDVTQVPRNIAKLQCLETLDLGKQAVVTVPAEVVELPHLKHLLGKFKLIPGDSGKKRLKSFLSEKSKLETLAGFVTGRSRGFPRLMLHMIRLRKVKIWFDSDADKRNLADISQAINQLLVRASSMTTIHHSLSIDFQHGWAAFLHSLVAPDVNSISSLKLRCRGQLRRIPGFVTNLGGIKDLCLSWTTLSGDSILAGLNKLVGLKYLKLVADKIEGISMVTATGEVKNVILIQPEQLKSLERMCLVANQRLPQITIQPGALKRLVSLHLICENLDGLSGVEIILLTRLEQVTLHAGVTRETKDAWKAATMGHDNVPRVSFKESL